MQIILGGGRQVFEAATDNGTTMWPCKRGDNKDLVSAWMTEKSSRGLSGAFLQNRQDLLKVDLHKNDYILGKPLKFLFLFIFFHPSDGLTGLFSPSHLPYELERMNINDPKATPGIEDMTEKAIRFLQKKGENKVCLKL